MGPVLIVISDAAADQAGKNKRYHHLQQLKQLGADRRMLSRFTFRGHERRMSPANRRLSTWRSVHSIHNRRQADWPLFGKRTACRFALESRLIEKRPTIVGRLCQTPICPISSAF